MNRLWVLNFAIFTILTGVAVYQTIQLKEITSYHGSQSWIIQPRFDQVGWELVWKSRKNFRIWKEYSILGIFVNVVSEFLKFLIQSNLGLNVNLLMTSPVLLVSQSKWADAA